MAVRFKYTPPKIDARVALAAAGAVAVEAAAQALLDASQPLVPEETGALKASGRVEGEGLHRYVTYGRDDDNTVEITGFSDDGAAQGRETHAPTNQYVEIQHEDMEFHHPNGGGAKFLEKPMNSEHDAIAAAMALPLRKVFE